MNPHFGPGTMAYGQRMMDGQGVPGGFGIAALFLAVAAAVVVVAIVVWALSRTHRSETVASTPPAGDTALEIARERLARGEIDPGQYTAIVAALKT
ncbi:MAG: hypothetical protein Q7W44_00235 [Coriobacteriia bacterium]|nr:hypothetical protein [Coriobacteriia bacterium]